jgi:hypothetical protein
VVYVDADASSGGDGTSWETAYRYLQDALRAANRGDELWIAEGTYYPDRSDANAALRRGFLVNTSVSLYGGFSGDEASRSQRDPEAHPVVLSGDVDQNDATNDAGITPSADAIEGTNWPVACVSAAGGTVRAVLSGLTITGGDANRRIDTPSGGGILCGSNCDLRLRDVAVVGNRSRSPKDFSATTAGGGRSRERVRGAGRLRTRPRRQKHPRQRTGVCLTSGPPTCPLKRVNSTSCEICDPSSHSPPL